MQGFIFRFSALGIRFLCPIVALTLSNVETMGKYYIFISYFTFAVGVSSLELAVPFSRKFILSKSARQKKILFSGFLANQIVVSTALSIPIAFFASSWFDLPLLLASSFCLLLTTEACVNESSRFFWNIGESRLPSLQDLIRASIFTTAIVSSIYFQSEVLSAQTCIIISLGNLIILRWEWKFWGLTRRVRVISPYHLIKGVWLRVKRSLKGSMPQFIHIQLLSLQPLLERVLLEKTLGLAFVAAFSFFISLVQTAAGLLLVPRIASLKKRLISIRLTADNVETKNLCLIMLYQITLLTGTLAAVGYAGIPLLQIVTGKSIEVTPLLMLTVCVTSVSAIFCSAIAPLMAGYGFAMRANSFALILLAFLYGAQLAFLEVKLMAIPLLAIQLVAFAQIIFRVFYLKNIVSENY